MNEDVFDLLKKIARDKLSYSAFKVWEYIYSCHCKKEDTTFEEIMEHCDIAVDTLMHSFVELIKKGYVEIGDTFNVFISNKAYYVTGLVAEDKGQFIALCDKYLVKGTRGEE